MNTKKWFDMALSVAPNNTDTIMNYASALCRLGQHTQSVKMALEGISKGNYTPESIHRLLLCAYYADNHAVIDEWLQKYEKLTGKPHHVASWLQEDAKDEDEIPIILEEVQKSEPMPWEQIKKELGL